MRYFAIGAALLAATSPAPPQAAEAAAGPSDCVCRLGAGAGAVLGTVLASSGAVYVTGRSGLEPLVTGARFRPDAMPRTGPGGRAKLLMGPNCSISLGANSLVTLTPLAQGFCVVVSDPPLPGARSGNLNPDLIAAGASMGSGLMITYGIGQSIAVSQ